MAKKTRTPEEQARIEERIAFVQANPQLSKAEARKRFYVQTRAKELEAQGKPVNRKALRQKFDTGQVTRGGFYTPSDIAAAQARIRTSANPAPRNNDTGRANVPSGVTQGVNPGVQNAIKPPTRTGRERSIYDEPKWTPRLPSEVKQDQSVLAKGLRKLGYDTGGFIDLGFSKGDILNRARNPKQLLDTYDKIMQQGNKRKVLGVSSSQIPGFAQVQRGIQKKLVYDLGTAESYGASFLNRGINRSKPIEKFFGEKPNLREAGAVETTMSTVELVAGGLPGKALKVVSKTPVIKQAIRGAGALSKPIARKAAPVAAGMGMSDLAPKLVKFGGTKAATEAVSPAAQRVASRKAAAGGGKPKKPKAPTTTPAPDTPAPAPSTAAQKPRKPRAQQPAPQQPAPSARNTGTGRANEAPAPQTPADTTRTGRRKKTPEEVQAQVEDIARRDAERIAKQQQPEQTKVSTPDEWAGKSDAEKRKEIANHRRAETIRSKKENQAKAAEREAQKAAQKTAPAPTTETPEQTKDWWSDQGGRLKQADLPENLQGRSIAIGSEQQKAAEEAADRYLGKKPKKSTSTAKTKAQVDREATQPAPQKRLPKAQNTGDGRGTARSIDDITFTNRTKFRQSARDPRFQELWRQATIEQQNAFVERHRGLVKPRGQAPSTPRGQAPSTPAPTQSSRTDTGARGTGRQAQQSMAVDDMSVGGYEVVERTPPPPAKKAPAAKKAAPPKREPKTAPETVRDTLDARAVQKELNAVESEFDNLERKKIRLEKFNGKPLSKEEQARYKALGFKRDQLRAKLRNFNAAITKETEKGARIGGTRD